MISGISDSQSFPTSRRTAIGVDIDRGATGGKAVSHELRTSIAGEVSSKFIRSLRTACLHLLEARYGIISVAHLRVEENVRASLAYSIPPPCALFCAVRLQVLPPMKEHGLCLSLPRKKPTPG